LGTQKHTLITLPDGEPFFWAADTAWNLLVKANISEAAEYFVHRRTQGFNTVQVTATGFNGDGRGHDAGGAGYGQSMLSRNGEYPWLQSDMSPVPPPGTQGLDPTKPNPKFWAHVDSILDVASDHGFQVALWPAWGSCFVSKGGCSWDTPLHSIFNTSDAGWQWGRFIGQRYGRRPNVLYVLGGDIAEPVTPEQRKAVYRAMAEGIAQGVAESAPGAKPSHRPAWNDTMDPLWGKQLISLHPGGKLSSSDAFGGEPWLSFNMIQSGFGRQAYIVPLIQRDYTSYSVPTFMGEGAYERSTGYTWCGQGPIGNRSTRGVTHPWGVRLNAWWSVLAGGFGYTYGSEGTWEWRNNLTDQTDPKGYALYTWREAVQFPGAGQLGHLSDLGSFYSTHHSLEHRSIPFLLIDCRIAHHCQMMLCQNRFDCWCRYAVGPAARS
jgi:hypothetical protein